MMVREVDRNVETAYKSLQADIEKWKKRKSMANFSYILSMYKRFKKYKSAEDY